MEVHDFRNLGWIASHASEGGLESFMLVTNERALFDSRNMTEERKELLDAITSSQAEYVVRVDLTGGEVASTTTRTTTIRGRSFRGWDILTVERQDNLDMQSGVLHIHFERISPNANLKTIGSHAPGIYDDVESFGSW